MLGHALGIRKVVGHALLGAADLPDVPLAVEFARNDEERKILETAFLSYEFGRPYMTTPVIPTDRLAGLRKAFMDTMADKEFLAEAEKAKFEITPVAGEKVAALVEEIYRTTSAADAEKAAAMVFSARATSANLVSGSGICERKTLCGR